MCKFCLGVLSKRVGLQPHTSRPAPHSQIDQNAPARLQDMLIARTLTLGEIELGRSAVSVPDSRAFLLAPSLRRGPSSAFMGPGEFAHIHGPNDGSLHVMLPVDILPDVFEAGWGEPHPFAGTMAPPELAMLYGPRNEEELEIIFSLVKVSYNVATA